MKSTNNSTSASALKGMYLEHANISTANVDEAVRFFQTAFPDFKIRGSGQGTHGKWLHLGNAQTYLAINQAAPNAQPLGKNYDRIGFNHLGFVVSDVASIAERMFAAGYERSYPKQEQRFRVRDYFLDAEGNEYEFVQYLSENVAERNDYSA